MSILIQINGETANEAIRELSALASAITGQAVTDTPAPGVTAESPKADKPARTRSKQEPAKDVRATPAETQDEQPASETQIEPDLDEAESDEPIPTDVELRAVAAEIGKKGPDAKKKVKALLDKYGVPNITAVPVEKRVTFKRELEGLA